MVTKVKRFQRATRRAAISNKSVVKQKKRTTSCELTSCNCDLSDAPSGQPECSYGGLSVPSDAPSGEPECSDGGPTTPSNVTGFAKPLVESERKQMMAEIDRLRRERDQAREGCHHAKHNMTRERLSARAVERDDSACKAMTGLSWTVFECLHEFLVQFVKGRTFKVPTQDQLFITLLKLRQNPSVALLSHVLDMITRWINIMHAKITFLIHWPDRECIFTAIPPDMRAKFHQLTSIIDCFEIRIKYSRKLKAR